MKKDTHYKFYHGTSTIFLDSILKNGLAGIDPIEQWKILELSKEVFTLCETHLANDKEFQLKFSTFKNMIEQSSNGNLNFQHGQTYITPSRQTAINYAISNKYGSELLTRTILFLKKLLDLELNYVKTDLYKKFPKIFRLIESNPSPVLIEIKSINASDLLSETGENPQSHFETLYEYKNENIQTFELLTQQINFRLINKIEVQNLSYWLINVIEWKPMFAEYNLYELRKVE